MVALLLIPLALLVIAGLSRRKAPPRQERQQAVLTRQPRPIARPHDCPRPDAPLIGPGLAIPHPRMLRGDEIYRLGQECRRK